MNDRPPAREGRLLRLAFTLTLVGLLAAVPVVVTWLFGNETQPGSSDGLAVLAAAAFAAASILFVGAGRTVGAMVALPAIAIGGLLDDPPTMALVLLVAAPVAEVAGSIAAFGYPERALDAWRDAAAEIRHSTTSALARGPLRHRAGAPWVLDRIAIVAAVGATGAIAVWAVLVTAFGTGDDPATRTVLPAATEFPWVLGAGLALSLLSAVACVLTGRLAGALMALPLVPAVWLDAPQRSEVVVVTVAAACGLLAVLASPIPRGSPS
jgi:hypothetical protein